MAPLLTVLGPGGTAYWITYDTDRGVAWVLATDEPLCPGEPLSLLEAVSGIGCDRVGFRLVMSHPHLVYELLVASRRPMVVVRGTAANFAQVGTWPAAEGRVRHG